MVFFHGYLSSKESFAAQINYFSRFYRVTAFDFLGFGKSPAIPSAFSVSDYAQWTIETLNKLGVQTPHVIAHSFGCRVAVKIAKDRSDFFDKILLTGPAGVVLRRPLSYRIKVAAYRICKRFLPSFAEKNFGSKDYRSLSPTMKESFKKIVNEDLRQDARQVENQVLIVEGERDTTTPLKEARAYLSCFERGALKRMNGGHFAFAEYPLAFNLIAEEYFLNGRID